MSLNIYEKSNKFIKQYYQWSKFTYKRSSLEKAATCEPQKVCHHVLPLCNSLQASDSAYYGALNETNTEGKRSNNQKWDNFCKGQNPLIHHPMYQNWFEYDKNKHSNYEQVI